VHRAFACLGAADALDRYIYSEIASLSRVPDEPNGHRKVGQLEAQHLALPGRDAKAVELGARRVVDPHEARPSKPGGDLPLIVSVSVTAGNPLVIPIVRTPKAARPNLKGVEQVRSRFGLDFVIRSIQV
jgi:hypothetical protein